MDLIGSIDEACHIVAQIVPLTLVNMVKSTCVQPLLARVYTGAVDLDRLPVCPCAGNRIDAAVGFEAVAHRCFDTDPPGIRPGRHRDRQIHISVDGGIASIGHLRLFVEFRDTDGKRPFVVKTVCGIDLSDLTGSVVQRRILVKEPDRRCLLRKLLDAGQQVLFVRYLRIKTRIVLEIEELSFCFNPDVRRHIRQDRASRRKNIR